MRNFTRRQRLQYAFDNTMSRGTSALVAWLALATLGLVVLFTLVTLAAQISPRNDGGHRPGFFRQIFVSFAHAIDPGAVGGDTGGWPFLLTMIGLTIGGIFIVSALIGVIATGLDERLQELRKGRSTVIEQDHTLILGWSESIYTILSELAIANESEKDPVIVVLAPRDKVEMEDAIAAKVGDTGKTRIVCRTGDPVDLDDLQIVNPDASRSIIVLSGDSDDPDAEVIKTVLALTQGPSRRPEPYQIVAEISDASNLEAARLVGGDETVLIDKGITVSRLIVQASRQSGISVVYTDLLDFGGAEIYSRPDPALAGKTFGDALFAYEDCTVIGLRSNGSAKLNPPMETPIGPGDEVIAIAEDDSVLAVAKPLAATVDEAVIVSPNGRTPTPQKVLLLGWNGRAPAVIAELDEYVQPGSAVTVVADIDEPGGALERVRGQVKRLEVEFRRGNTTDRRTLDALGVDAYSSVIVLCYSDALDAQKADARTLVTLLHLRDIGARTGAHFTIVSELLDDRDRQLAQVTKVDDVIVSDKVISLMIAQLSENPWLSTVFQDLFDAEGSEIYMRPAEQYATAGAAVSFATIVEAARRRNEAAVGYRTRDGESDAERNFGVTVNPAKSETFTISPGDRVIVLAED
jgi:ion channel POLLUX/CASTOR